MKYEEAYCDTEERSYTPEEVAYIWGNDTERYAQKIERHLLCPGCHLVPLSFVNTIRPHFRGYPYVDHDIGCIKGKKELEPSEVKRLHETPDGEQQILAQINRLAIQFLRNNSSDLELDAHHIVPNKKIEITDLYRTIKWQPNKVVPQKRIDRPLDEGDYNTEKLFHGRVKLTWEDMKDSSRKKLLMWDLKTNKLICRLHISDKVYGYLPQQYKQIKSCGAYIVFMTALTRKESKSSWSWGNLTHSTHLHIIPLKQPQKKEYTSS